MKYLFRLILAAMLAGFVFTACTEDKEEEITDPDTATMRKVNSCEGCHTNYEHLKKVYSPDPPSTGGHGCGGDAPHFEPYDRVYMDSENADFAQFKNSVHGKLECTYCHNGVNSTAVKDSAHSNNFIASPSAHAEEKCASCHPDVVTRTQNSLHANGWGQKAQVTRRMGLGTGPEKFDQLPEELKQGYQDNCSSCHGTCADCHVTRPAAGGGGLMNSHNFGKPDMRNNCTTCHSSRGGHAYFGIAAGTKPDVHYEKMGFECMDCHSQHEVHGDGNYYDQRYKMAMLPECSDCHSGIDESNRFHKMHFEDFSCNVCHSQDYNNCGSCHVGEEGARIASHQKFKIGMNPIPDIKTEYRMATLREAPHAPDSWSHYGVDNMPEFAVRPTYKYTTPHNIQRVTTRTAGEDGEVLPDPDCWNSCHIMVVEGDTLNKEFYLFEEDLEEWEKEANQNTVVDGKLPAWWGIN